MFWGGATGQLPPDAPNYAMAAFWSKHDDSTTTSSIWRTQSQLPATLERRDKRTMDTHYAYVFWPMYINQISAHRAMSLEGNEFSQPICKGPIATQYALQGHVTCFHDNVHRTESELSSRCPNVYTNVLERR